MHPIEAKRMPSGMPFETEISRSLRLVSQFAPIYYKKLFDTSAYRGRLICPRCGARVSSPFIAATTISDHIVFLPGRIVFLEEKLFRTPEFSLSRISRDQLLWAYRLSRMMGDAGYYFLVNDRRARRHYRAWALDFRRLEQAVELEGRLSLRPETLEEVGIEIRRLPNMLWDLFDLLGFSDVLSPSGREEAARNFDSTTLSNLRDEADDVWKTLKKTAKMSRGRSR